MRIGAISSQYNTNNRAKTQSFGIGAGEASGLLHDLQVSVACKHMTEQEAAQKALSFISEATEPVQKMLKRFAARIIGCAA